MDPKTWNQGARSIVALPDLVSIRRAAIATFHERAAQSATISESAEWLLEQAVYAAVEVAIDALTGATSGSQEPALQRLSDNSTLLGGYENKGQG